MLNICFVSALGLQCYSCKINGPTSLCDKVTNSSVTNCTGLLNACVTTAMTIKAKIVGGMEKNVYTMACAEKVCVQQINVPNKSKVPVGQSGQSVSKLDSQSSSQSQLVSQSVGQSVSQSVCQSVIKPKSVSQSVSQPVSLLVSQSVGRSVSQSVSQSVGRRVGGSVSQ